MSLNRFDALAVWRKSFFIGFMKTRKAFYICVYNVQMQNADSAFRGMEWKTIVTVLIMDLVKKHENAQMLKKTSHTYERWANEQRREKKILQSIRIAFLFSFPFIHRVPNRTQYFKYILWLISWKICFAKNSCVANMRKKESFQINLYYTYVFGIVESDTGLCMCKAKRNKFESLNIHISPFRIETNLNCLRFCLFPTPSLPLSLWWFVFFHFLFRLLTLFLFCVLFVAY